MIYHTYLSHLYNFFWQGCVHCDISYICTQNPSTSVNQRKGYQLGGIFKLPQDILSRLVSPHALLPCPFAWNDVRLGNDVPAAFLGSCGGWGSLERYAWVHTIDVSGMIGAEGWTMVGAVRSIHPFVEDVDSTAGSRRKGPHLHLVNVWHRSVLHFVFIRNPTSSPFSPSSPSAPSATTGSRNRCHQRYGIRILWGGSYR